MKKICGYMVFSVLFFSACSKNCMEIIMTPLRQSSYPLLNSNKAEAYKFYRAITRYQWDYDVIKQMLADGADPNYCHGEYGWIDSNPLMILARSFYNTYYNVQYEKKNNINTQAQKPDSRAIQLLIDFGADIHLYPYIWEIIVIHGKVYLEHIKKNDFRSEKERSLFVEDSIRLLKTFLDLGANPNMKGHPYPFSFDAPHHMSNEEMTNYFTSKEATTPICEAIKIGAAWESQIDLLLDFGATLDENCLEIARQTGDKTMIEKIENMLSGLN